MAAGYSEATFGPNCRWSTHQEQVRNQRSNRWLTLQGETRLLSEWSRILDIHLTTLHGRIRKGWSIEDAFMTKPKKVHMVTLGSETKSLAQWARESGLHLETVRSCLKNGWSIEKALATPSVKITRTA